MDSPYPTPTHTSHHNGNAALLPTPAPTLATPSTTTIPAPIPIHAGHHDGDAALAPSRDRRDQIGRGEPGHPHIDSTAAGPCAMSKSS